MMLWNVDSVVRTLVEPSLLVNVVVLRQSSRPPMTLLETSLSNVVNQLVNELLILHVWSECRYAHTLSIQYRHLNNVANVEKIELFRMRYTLFSTTMILYSSYHLRQ